MEAVKEDVDEKEEKPVEEIVKFLPPVYSRQLRLFGIVVWSDDRQLDEDMFFDRVAARINSEIAKEVIILRAKINR